MVQNYFKSKFYNCEKKFSEADGSAQTGDMCDHNRDWETNENRCLMCLEEISEIDERWSEESLEAFNFFHKKKTITNLR